MRTLVVIVNYKTADLTVDCLASLEPEVAAVSASHGPVEVVVTDNASGDDSPARIAAAIEQRGWSSWARLQPLERNGGFAYGNNRAVEPALGRPHGEKPDFFWLLNPDTVVRPGALDELLKFMADNPRAGIAGSRLEEPDGTAQRSAFRFPTVASEVDGGLRFGPVTRLLKRRQVAPPPPTARVQTEWVAGASMLVRREVYEQAGLMDEAYFMYFEEVDFCRRALRSGWPCWYVPESRVVHLVGQASGVVQGDKARRRRPAYWFESRRRYFLTHLGRGGTLLADAAFLGGFLTYRLRRAVQRKPDADPVHFAGDFFKHSTLRRGFGL